MTVQQLWVQDAEYQAADDRLLLAALLPVGTRGPLGSGVGIRKVDDLVLTMSGGFNGSVSRGAAFIEYGPSIYLLTNDAAVPVTFGPADPTLARIDILVAQVHDVEVGGAAAPAEIRVIPGAASATPVAPALPAGALLLNTLRYNAGATAPINTRNAQPIAPPIVPARAGATATSFAANALTTTAATATIWASQLDSGGFFQGGANPLRVPAGMAGIYQITAHLSVTPTSGGTAQVQIRGIPTAFAAGGVWVEEFSATRTFVSGVAALAVGAAPSVSLQAIGAAWSSRQFDLYLSMYRISD